MNEYKLLPDNEVTTVEDRVYLNPNLQTEQTNNFIDNLRSAQQSNNQQIQAQTQGLGTQVPSNLGGLTGGKGYWTSRYQTPQTNTAIQNLRAASLLAAMEQAGKNEKAMWDKRYKEAYYAYQKRQNDKTNTPKTQNPGTADVEKNVTTPQEFFGVPGAIVSETDTHYIYTDPKTGEQTKVSKDYMKQIYDEDGNITDDGMVILDTRRMLGL